MTFLSGLAAAISKTIVDYSDGHYRMMVDSPSELSSIYSIVLFMDRIVKTIE